jgi:hypothetical protein
MIVLVYSAFCPRTILSLVTHCLIHSCDYSKWTSLSSLWLLQYIRFKWTQKILMKTHIRIMLTLWSVCMISFLKQPVLSAKSSRGVLISPLAHITELGYFSLGTFTDTVCSNINNLAVGASLLLNTCSLFENGKYTKVKRSFFSVYSENIREIMRWMYTFSSINS